MGEGTRDHGNRSPIHHRPIFGVVRLRVFPVMSELAGQGVLVELDAQAGRSGVRACRVDPSSRNGGLPALVWMSSAFGLDSVNLESQPRAIENITLAPKKLILTRRASEGSASEPSLARRVSMCKDAKLSCRGNNPVLIHEVAAEQDVRLFRMGQNLHQVWREIPDREFDEVCQDQP